MKIEGLGTLIEKLWGTDEQCANALGVSSRTIKNWKTQNPRGILKYAPEIVKDKDITWTQLSGEVLFQEEMLSQ